MKADPNPLATSTPLGARDPNRNSLLAAWEDARSIAEAMGEFDPFQAAPAAS